MLFVLVLLVVVFLLDDHGGDACLANGVVEVGDVVLDDPVEFLGRVKDRVITMHASDRYLEPGTSLPDMRQEDGTLGYPKSLCHGVVGQGLNDYDAIFKILSETGYRGWISIEDGMNGMDEMKASIEFLEEKISRYYL